MPGGSWFKSPTLLLKVNSDYSINDLFTTKEFIVLLSMTGYGTGREQLANRCIIVEVKTVNNRYLKISTRYPELFSSLESQMEKVVREYVTRGTVSINIRTELISGTDEYQLHPETIRQYWRQLQEIAQELRITDLTTGRDLAQLALLPGSITERGGDQLTPEEIWPACESALRTALEQLQAFRRREGKSTTDDLRNHCRTISSHVDEIAKKSESIVGDYRDRLLQRVNDMMKDYPVTVSGNDVIREVSLFADRCDINEELTRLRCHLEKFESFLGDAESQGRKLDFLGQEIFREINTLGSKANDVSISHLVVEMKTALERIRENVQNVE